MAEYSRPDGLILIGQGAVQPPHAPAVAIDGVLHPPFGRQAGKEFLTSAPELAEHRDFPVIPGFEILLCVRSGLIPSFRSN